MTTVGQLLPYTDDQRRAAMQQLRTFPFRNLTSTINQPGLLSVQHFVSPKCSSAVPNQASETSPPNCFLLIYVRRARGANPLRLRQIISVHCAARATYGKLPLRFNVFSVKCLQSQAEIVLRAIALRPTRSVSLHLASGRTQNRRSTFLLRVGKWVFGQILLPYTCFVRVRIRRWKRAYFAG